jgi:hypothetical protein
LAEYARDMSRTIAASIRAARNPTPPFQLPLSKTAFTQARELDNELNSGEATWKSLHPLLRTFWELPNKAIGNEEHEEHEGYLIRFLAAAALKEDGTLMNAKRLVSWITHLKYSARAFCMVEAVEVVNEHDTILK